VDSFARRRQGPEQAASSPAAPAALRGARQQTDLGPILQLQALAGNQAVVRMLDARRARGAGRSGAASIPIQRRTTAADRKRRKRAAALKAADARGLLQASLPFALEHMSAEQVGQMQRVLDAAVVNPEVQKEVEELSRGSVIAQSGSLANRDPAMVRRANRAIESYVPVSESDKRIRLDFKPLLSSDALTPRTDNPDEVAYLKRVRQTLTSKGVWLRFAPKLVRDPEDPSRHIVDPRSFEAWLSIGPGGDAIPSRTGELTREALIGTTLFGAGYYEQVHKGPAQSALDREIKRLIGSIESGMELNDMLAKIRREAFFGVAEASDLLGGADFPDRSIWDQPHKLVVRAMEMNVGGNLLGAQAFLVVAAVLTRNAARLLADYIDDSSTGVERAVTVLKVAKTAGQVAEVGLAVTGVVGLARGGFALAGGAGGGALASDVEVAAEQLARRYAARNGIHADELTKVRFVPQPKGSVAGGVKPGTSSGAGTGWHKW
jgi:hypothetical protein